MQIRLRGTRDVHVSRFFCSRSAIGTPSFNCRPCQPGMHGQDLSRCELQGTLTGINESVRFDIPCCSDSVWAACRSPSQLSPRTWPSALPLLTAVDLLHQPQRRSHKIQLHLHMMPLLQMLRLQMLSSHSLRHLKLVQPAAPATHRIKVCRPQHQQQTHPQLAPAILICSRLPWPCLSLKMAPSKQTLPRSMGAEPSRSISKTLEKLQRIRQMLGTSCRLGSCWQRLPWRSRILVLHNQT